MQVLSALGLLRLLEEKIVNINSQRCSEAHSISLLYLEIHWRIESNFGLNLNTVKPHSLVFFNVLSIFSRLRCSFPVLLVTQSVTVTLREEAGR
jgi:hypothetical protein